MKETFPEVGESVFRELRTTSEIREGFRGGFEKPKTRKRTRSLTREPSPERGYSVDDEDDDIIFGSPPPGSPPPHLEEETDLEGPPPPQIPVDPSDPVQIVQPAEKPKEISWVAPIVVGIIFFYLASYAT